MTTVELLITVLVCAAVTAALRYVSFALFPQGKQPPKFIIWLGSRLPRAVMAMIVVYCLKDVSFASAVNWLPPLLGVAATAALHVWKRQMMLSIAGGTAIYMIFIRLL